MLRRATDKDVKSIKDIMESFALPKSIFITSDENRIRELVNNQLCLVYDERGKIISFVLTDGGNYIDTICSLGRGKAKIVLQGLPSGEYEVNISPLNERSKRLFSGLGFSYMYDEVVEGENRGRYKGYIRQRNSFE